MAADYVIERDGRRTELTRHGNPDRRGATVEVVNVGPRGGRRQLAYLVGLDRIAAEIETLRDRADDLQRVRVAAAVWIDTGELDPMPGQTTVDEHLTP